MLQRYIMQRGGGRSSLLHHRPQQEVTRVWSGRRLYHYTRYFPQPGFEFRLESSTRLFTGPRYHSSFFAHDWHKQGFLSESSLEEKKEWLEDLVKHHPSEVDAEAYIVVLRAIANSSLAGAPQQAELLLSRMIVDPNDGCYQAVLDVWSTSKHEDASQCVLRSERWFEKIKEPTIESYHLLLNAVSRGRAKSNNRVRRKELLIEHATKAEQILESMPVSPDTKAYNFVIRAWSRVRQDPDLMVTKITDWLQRMEEQQQKQPSGPIRPNTQSYCMGMECFAVLAGHRAKVGPGDGSEEVEQVQRLLKYMQDLQKDGHTDAAPNTVAYNILISAYARLSLSRHHPTAPLKAEEVLRRMIAIGQDAEPDFLSFTKVIQAWSNAKKQTSGRRAAYWLDKLWDRFEEKGNDESLRPKIGTYNAVMKASKDDPEAVEKVFVELLRAEKADGETMLRPNSESFALLIHAWTSHDLPRAVMWLEDLVRRGEETVANPDAGFSVTTTPELFHVILKNAAENPSAEHFDLGVKAFDHYRASRHALDVKSYAWLLQLGLHVLSEAHSNQERTTFIDEIIQDCRNDGLVSNVFIRVLANGAVYYNGWTAEESKATMQEYFSEWPLPQSWTRNIHHQFHLPERPDAIRSNNEVLYRDAEQDQGSQ